MLEQFPAVAAAVAAESFTTEQVCKILSTVRDRNKMEDWRAICWSNKNDSLYFKHNSSLKGPDVFYSNLMLAKDC